MSVFRGDSGNGEVTSRKETAEPAATHAPGSESQRGERDQQDQRIRPGRAHGVGPAPGAGAGQGRQAARRGRGDGPAARPRRRPGQLCWPTRAAPGTPGSRPPGGPGVITYSRKVFIPLTRLCRDRCGYCTFATVPHRLEHLYLEPDEVLARSPARAPNSAARKPCSPWATGRRTAGTRPGVAGRARLRRHPVLRAGHGHPRARGDRPAPAPEPGRAELAGLPAAQAGRPVHGHDARDDRQPPVHRQGRPALRQPGQGPRGPAARPGGRRPQQRPVHHGHPHRHRRDPGRAGRDRSSPSARSPASTAASRKSSCRTSGPSRTPRCATSRTPNSTTWPPRSP